MEIMLTDDSSHIMGPINKLHQKNLEDMRKQLGHLLNHDCRKPSISPCRSHVLFTATKEGSLRMMVHYRAEDYKNI